MSGPITKALEEAIKLRRSLLAGGMSEAEANHRIGQSLKAVLGRRREGPWRFYCEACRDTGWLTMDPSPDEQARLTRLYGEGAQAAGYVKRCQPCKWAEMEREKRRQKFGEDGEDDFEAAGQTKRGFRKLV